jgi:hypothetical protein
MPQGIIDDLSMREYLEYDAISASDIVKVIRSPLHWKRSVRKQTKSLGVGEAFHKITLEGRAAFDEEFAVWKGGYKKGKEWEAFVNDNATKHILSQDEMADVYEMSLSVTAHPIAKNLLLLGNAEESMFWLESDLWAKCRLDFVSNSTKTPIIVELKSTRDASLEAFQRQSYTLGYYIKYRWYQHAFNVFTGETVPVYVISTENVAPFDTVVYQVDQDSMDYADDKIHKALETIRACKKTEVYPGISSKLETLSLPPWIKTRRQETKLIIEGEEVEL